MTKQISKIKAQNSKISSKLQITIPNNDLRPGNNQTKLKNQSSKIKNKFQASNTKI
jgi:hypothetical protein